MWEVETFPTPRYGMFDRAPGQLAILKHPARICFPLLSISVSRRNRFATITFETCSSWDYALTSPALCRRCASVPAHDIVDAGSCYFRHEAEPAVGPRSLHTVQMQREHFPRRMQTVTSSRVPARDGYRLVQG